jgi:hypothetical protein
VVLRDLTATGYTKEQAEKIIANSNEFLPKKIRKKMETRAVVAGKSVSIYNYPDAVPDPNIETVAGKYAYGFDLGSPNRANKFIDPDTGGPVDNQLWRAVGCLDTFRGIPPDMPYPEKEFWAKNVDQMPGWALQITGDDLSKDGKVTVTWSLTTQHLLRNANGEVMSHASYTIDQGRRTTSVLEGEIKDGVLTIRPGFIRIRGTLYHEIDISKAQLRIHSETGGKLVGYVGGYINWVNFVFPYLEDPGWGADDMGMFHALKKMADANPDPSTAQNQEISATFRLEAIPAYLTSVEGAVLAKPGLQNASLGKPD